MAAENRKAGRPVAAASAAEQAARTETLVATSGTAEQVAQAAEKPVVIGAAETPIEPGGPGVGAAKTARAVEGVATRPLTGSAETDLGLRPLTEAERIELDGHRRALEESPEGRAILSERAELAAHRLARSEPALVVDAANVAGTRRARVAAPIKRDGRLHLPGDDHPFVAVDFEAYTELVQIGAITDTPWPELDRVAAV